MMRIIKFKATNHTSLLPRDYEILTALASHTIGMDIPGTLN